MKKVAIRHICMEEDTMEVSLLKGVPPQPYSTYKVMNAIVEDSVHNSVQF